MRRFADADIVNRLAFGAVAFFQIVPAAPPRFDGAPHIRGLCEGGISERLKYRYAAKELRFDNVEKRLSARAPRSCRAEPANRRGDAPGTVAIATRKAL